jgi:YQGE family putative transporter
VPFDSATLNIIDKNAAEFRTEYIILKEISLNAGRLTGVSTFLLLLARNNSPSVMRIFLLVIGSVHLTLLLFRNKLDFDVDVVKDS